MALLQKYYVYLYKIQVVRNQLHGVWLTDPTIESMQDFN